MSYIYPASWRSVGWPQSASRFAGRARNTWTSRRYSKYRKRRYKARYRGKKAFKLQLLQVKEAKFLDDTSVSGTPVFGTSVVQYVSGTTQADTETGRDGHDIFATSFQLKGLVSGDVDSITDTLAMIMLVQMKDVRGTILSIADMFVSDNPFAMRNTDNMENFKILKTWRTTLKVKTTTADFSKTFISWYVKFKKPIRIKYSGSGNAIGDADRNGLFLIFLTDAAATFGPGFQLQTRMVFKDI